MAGNLAEFVWFQSKVQSLEMRVLEQSSAVEQAETARQALRGELDEKTEEVTACMQRIDTLQSSIQLQKQVSCQTLLNPGREKKHILQDNHEKCKSC